MVFTRQHFVPPVSWQYIASSLRVFLHRNRFFFVAKHFLFQLAECIPSSHFFKKGEYDHLYRTLVT